MPKKDFADESGVCGFVLGVLPRSVFGRGLKPLGSRLGTESLAESPRGVLRKLCSRGLCSGLEAAVGTESGLRGPPRDSAPRLCSRGFCSGTEAAVGTESGFWALPRIVVRRLCSRGICLGPEAVVGLESDLCDCVVPCGTTSCFCPLGTGFRSGA